jgi:hypothetical protein
MAEDRGAFKTNPAKWCRIRHFVIAGRTVAPKPHRLKKLLSGPSRGLIPTNCNKRRRQPCGIFEPG